VLIEHPIRHDRVLRATRYAFPTAAVAAITVVALSASAVAKIFTRMTSMREHESADTGNAQHNNVDYSDPILTKRLFCESGVHVFLYDLPFSSKTYGR